MDCRGGLNKGAESQKEQKNESNRIGRTGRKSMTEPYHGATAPHYLPGLSCRTSSLAVSTSAISLLMRPRQGWQHEYCVFLFFGRERQRARIDSRLEDSKRRFSTVND